MFKFNRTFLCVAVAATVLLTGCVDPKQVQQQAETISALKAEINSLQDENAQNIRELADVVMERNTLEREIQKSKISAKETQKDLQEKLNLANAQIKDLQEAASEDEAELKKLVNDLQQAQQEKADLLEAHKTATETLTGEHEAEVTALNKQITDLTTQLETALNRATFSEGQIASIKAILTPEEIVTTVAEPEEALTESVETEEEPSVTPTPSVTSEETEQTSEPTTTSPEQPACEIEDECPVTDTPDTVESVDNESTDTDSEPTS